MKRLKLFIINVTYASQPAFSLVSFLSHSLVYDSQLSLKEFIGFSAMPCAGQAFAFQKEGSVSAGLGPPVNVS